MISSRQVEKLLDGSLASWESFVPQIGPKGLLDLLPALPYRVPKRLILQSDVMACVAQLEFISMHQNKVKKLRTGNEYEKEMYERVQSQVHDFQENIKCQASKMWLVGCQMAEKAPKASPSGAPKFRLVSICDSGGRLLERLPGPLLCES